MPVRGDAVANRGAEKHDVANRGAAKRALAKRDLVDRGAGSGRRRARSSPRRR